MNICPEIRELIEAEAHYIVRNTEFLFNDAFESMERAYQYYINCGNAEYDAWNRARDLVAAAVYSARRNNFNLDGMVRQMIFSEFHRVQPGCGLL